MSKRNKHTKPQAAPAKRVASAHMADKKPFISDGVQNARDSYVNVPARLGMAENNLLAASGYTISRMTDNMALMTALYRNDWIANRIIDTPAEDMVKNWYTLDTVADPKYLDSYRREERRANIRAKILAGLKWSRLYGGAAGLMMIRGQEEMLEQPLDAAMIMPGDFRGILVLDRWNGVTPSTQLVADPSDDEFGLPEYYDFSLGGGYAQSVVRVHHSRVLPFYGRELPYIERVANNWWGASELEHVYEELTKRNAASANIAQLIFPAKLRILKMQDFGQLLTATSPQQQRELYQVLSAQAQLMNSMGVQVMDSTDSFESLQYTFSGVADVYELFMMDIAGASEIPATKLFGRAPQGMNATGESDLRNYYDSIQQKLEAVLRPVLNKLVPVLCMSAWGAVPDDLDFTFDSIRNPSDQELASILQQKSAAIKDAYASDIISQRTALREYRKLGDETGVFATITDEDIEKADDSTGMAPGEIDLFGAGAPQEPAAQPLPEPVADAKSDPKQWITLENGTHVPVGKNGTIQGKGGLSGQKYDPSKGARRTASDPKGHTVTKSYDPDDYANVTVGFKGNTKETPTGGITTKTKLDEHQRRHGKSMGFKNAAAYNKAGVEFLSKPMDENTDEMLTSEGRMRYNYRTNEYATTNRQGDMTSYYHPTEGRKYWDGQVERYGKKHQV